MRHTALAMHPCKHVKTTILKAQHSMSPYLVVMLDLLCSLVVGLSDACRQGVCTRIYTSQKTLHCIVGNACTSRHVTAGNTNASNGNEQRASTKQALLIIERRRWTVPEMERPSSCLQTERDTWGISVSVLV